MNARAILTLLAAVLAFALPAHATSPPITQHRPPGNERPAWSPDGRTIAFTSTRSGHEEIYVMNADGSGERRLTARPAVDAFPIWSPNGRTIAFQRFHGLRRDVWLMNADGTNQRRLGLPSSPGGVALQWSPDGRRLAFANDFRGGMVVVNADGTGKRRLTRRVVFSLAWSPDGRRIAFVNPDYAIYAVGVDGTGERRLTPATTSNNDPAWSPDGRKIVFTRLIDGFHEPIFVMDADGAGQRALSRTSTPASRSEPAWSPDGRRIAFTVQHDNPRIKRSFLDLYVMNADGGDERRLSAGERSDTHPAWSPDGRRLAFQRLHHAHPQIYVMDADGTHQTRLTG